MTLEFCHVPQKQQHDGESKVELHNLGLSERALEIRYGRVRLERKVFNIYFGHR